MHDQMNRVRKNKVFHRVAVTGGAGFVGSHLVEAVVDRYPDAEVIVIDKMTYASNLENIMPLYQKKRIRLEVGDIAEFEFCRQALQNVDLLIHAAAESHVCNSFGNSLLFTRTNVLGTHTLMEASRLCGVSHIVHISTDEVYGEIPVGEVDEQSGFCPTNPYSASKAAAEMLISGYIKSYKLPALIVRGNNIFGTRQYPEKILPKFCLHLHFGLKLPIHGNGNNVRHYISIADFVDGVMLLIDEGKHGEAYNIGSEEEYSNLAIASMLARQFDIDVRDAIEFVEDRPFNDSRYSVSCEKVRSLGWMPRRCLRDEIGSLVQWYRQNADRYSRVELGIEASRPLIAATV
jgi:UDP-glucose 4,6-dehydratase